MPGLKLSAPARSFELAVIVMCTSSWQTCLTVVEGLQSGLSTPAALQSHISYCRRSICNYIMVTCMVVNDLKVVTDSNLNGTVTIITNNAVLEIGN